jgi:hypothetical protein
MTPNKFEERYQYLRFHQVVSQVGFSPSSLDSAICPSMVKQPFRLPPTTSRASWYMPRDPCFGFLLVFSKSENDPNFVPVFQKRICGSFSSLHLGFDSLRSVAGFQPTLPSKLAFPHRLAQL